jgi:hypothetical protein
MRIDDAKRITAFGRAVDVTAGGWRARDEENFLLCNPISQFGVNFRTSFAHARECTRNSSNENEES